MPHYSYAMPALHGALHPRLATASLSIGQNTAMVALLRSLGGTAYVLRNSADELMRDGLCRLVADAPPSPSRSSRDSTSAAPPLGAPPAAADRADPLWLGDRCPCAAAGWLERHDRPASRAGVIRIVADHQHRDAAFADGGRRRRGGRHAGQDRAARRARREAGRAGRPEVSASVPPAHAVRPKGSPDRGRRSQRARPGRAPPRPPPFERPGRAHLLPDRRQGCRPPTGAEEQRVLKQDADAPLFGRQSCHVAPVQDDPALGFEIRRKMPTDEVDQCRFADAGRAHDRRHGARRRTVSVTGGTTDCHLRREPKHSEAPARSCEKPRSPRRRRWRIAGSPIAVR